MSDSILSDVLGFMRSNVDSFAQKQKRQNELTGKLFSKDATPELREQWVNELKEEAGNWAMPLGIISNAIRAAQGLDKVRVGRKTMHNLRTDPTENWASLRDKVVQLPGFNKFSERIQRQLTKEYGDTVPVFRGMGPEEAAALEKGEINKLLPVSVSPSSADIFRTGDGALLGARIPTKNVLFRSPFTGPMGHERELVVNPNSLMDAFLDYRASTKGIVQLPEKLTVK